MITNITDKKEFKVIGIEVRTTNAGGKGAGDCASLWGRFFAENLLDKIPNKLNPSVNFGLYVDYDKDFNVFEDCYTYIVGTEVSSLENIPEGMVGRVVPASKYAVVTTEGPFPEKIGEAWQYIWQTTTWGTGFKRAFTADMEVYDTARYMSPEKPEMDICISIEKAEKS